MPVKLCEANMQVRQQPGLEAQQRRKKVRWHARNCDLPTTPRRGMGMHRCWQVITKLASKRKATGSDGLFAVPCSHLEWGRAAGTQLAQAAPDHWRRGRPGAGGRRGARLGGLRDGGRRGPDSLRGRARLAACGARLADVGELQQIKRTGSASECATQAGP
jgi:hypothetical protein